MNHLKIKLVRSKLNWAEIKKIKYQKSIPNITKSVYLFLKTKERIKYKKIVIIRMSKKSLKVKLKIIFFNYKQYSRNQHRHFSIILFDWKWREIKSKIVARRKIRNLYFKKKIPVEKLMPKRENKTAKQEEQKAVAKIAEKIPDKVPRIPAG